jgi:hypothetical protein
MTSVTLFIGRSRGPISLERIAVGDTREFEDVDDGTTDYGVAHYGVWVACVLVAAKSHPRGTLSRNSGEPHDFRSIARITRIPESVIAAAIQRDL